MHSRIFSPKIGFICGMRKSASPRSAVPSAHRSRPAETAQRRTNQSDTADLRPAETEYSLPFRHNPAHARVHQSDRTAYRKDQTDRAEKTTCENPAVARRHHIRRHSGRRKISTEKAPEFSFAARPKRTGRITAGPPHYPYPERPCNLGSEQPAKPPCENYRFYLPNRSRFSYHPGLNAFRHAPGFPDGTPSGNTDRRSSPAQTSNLTDRP